MNGFCPYSGAECHLTAKVIVFRYYSVTYFGKWLQS